MPKRPAQILQLSILLANPNLDSRMAIGVAVDIEIDGDGNDHNFRTEWQLATGLSTYAFHQSA